MGGSEDFYGGADYGLDPSFNDNSGYLGFSGYTIPAGDLGFPSDPRSAEPARKVSDKLSTGAKTIEVSGVALGGQAMSMMDAIPKQQWKEVNRLKKLTGVDLTFHGPLVEATGVTRNGWDETQRQMAETEMWSAVDRAHEIDPDGNLVVTFHASNGLPDPETKVIDEKTGKEVITGIWVVDEEDGQFTNLGPGKLDYFKDGPEAVEKNVKKELEKRNKEQWSKSLQSASYHAYQGNGIVKNHLLEMQKDDKVSKLLKDKPIHELYALHKAGKTDEIVSQIKDPHVAELLVDNLREITHGELYVRDAYNDLKRLYNDAYASAKREKRTEDLEKLKAFQASIAPKMDGFDNDPRKIGELGEAIVQGVNVLNSVKTPQKLREMKEWAIDKAAESFSGVALKSYDKFRDTAPIVSIENPPAGSGLSRADDLRKLVDVSRQKFVDRATMSKKEGGLGMSEKAAEKQAEKLLGITWDVGHINMIRKFGYDEKDLIKETEKVAPVVKHVHLSDNFGLEHTELPMGMGNVPTKKHLELIEKFNKQKNKIKHIVETGGPWFEHYKATPFKESLEAFGSPVYAMKMAPTWNAAVATKGGYFSGYGMNPDIHHSIYGAGFSNLPMEFGGQMPGGGSRLSGAPMN